MSLIHMLLGCSRPLGGGVCFFRLRGAAAGRLRDLGAVVGPLLVGGAADCGGGVLQAVSLLFLASVLFLFAGIYYAAY